MSYQVTMPEAHYQKVLAGTAPFPNPGDISTMPNNSSATVRAENVSGIEGEGSIGAFGIGADRSTSSGNVVSMQVDGKGDVRVAAGPTDAVTHGNSVLAGKTIGPKDFQVGAEVSASNSTTVRNTEMSFLDLDRDSGQQAFNQFMASGEVPSASATGVLNGGTIRQSDISQEARLGGSILIGDLDVSKSFQVNGENTAYTEVEFNDGTSTQSLMVDTHESRMYANATKDAAGNTTSQDKGIIFDSVDASVREGAAAAFGQRAGPTGTMQWSMTEAEYNQARQMVSERFDTPLGQTRGFNNLSDAFLANATYDAFISDPRLRALATTCRPWPRRVKPCRAPWW